jgi:hypothetical protein
MSAQPDPSPSPSPSTSRPSRAQTRGGFLASAFDDPSMERYRTAQARRRISVLSALLSLILITVPVLLIVWNRSDPTFPSWAFAVAGVVLYIPWMFVTGMLNGSVSGIFDLKEVQLDETERQDRDAAYRTAYRAMVPVSLITLGAVIGIVSTEGGTSDAAWKAWVLWIGATYLLLQILLPRYIAAWRLAARGDAEDLGADAESYGS